MNQSGIDGCPVCLLLIALGPKIGNPKYSSPPPADTFMIMSNLYHRMRMPLLSVVLILKKKHHNSFKYVIRMCINCMIAL